MWLRNIARFILTASEWLKGRPLWGGVIGAVVLICILFAIPFRTVPYPVVETYEDIEIRWEPCQVPEAQPAAVVEREVTVYEGEPYSTPNGITVSFAVAAEQARLAGNFRLPAPGGFYLYSSTGRIIYEQLGTEGVVDIPLASGEYRVLLREGVFWGGNMRLSLKLRWTEVLGAADSGEISGYCGKPVTVEKQHTVTRYKKASLWQTIFGR